MPKAAAELAMPLALRGSTCFLLQQPGMRQTRMQHVSIAVLGGVVCSTGHGSDADRWGALENHGTGGQALTFGRDNKTSPFSGPPIHHLNNVNELLLVCHRPVDLQKGIAVNTDGFWPSAGLGACRGPAAARQRTLLLLPVPRSIMMCCSTPHRALSHEPAAHIRGLSLKQCRSY